LINDRNRVQNKASKTLAFLLGENMEIMEQLAIDKILRLAGGVSSSKQESNSVTVQGIDTSQVSGQYQAAYFICTLRQDKLSGEYRPLEQVKKLAASNNVQINESEKEPESIVNIPFFGGGL